MIVRPNAQGVACRLLILAFVAGKAIATPPAEVWRREYVNSPDDNRRRFIEEMDDRSRRLCEALKRSGLWEFMTPDETRFAEVSILEMVEDEQIQLSWAVEAVACLLWALNLADRIPPADQEVDPAILKLVPTSELRRFIDGARLRSSEEIDAARDLAELWHWRGRTRECQEAGNSPAEDDQLRRLGIKSYDDIVRSTAKMAKEKGMLEETIDEDFAAQGRAYRDLSIEEWPELLSISMERHRALNWLCGYAPAGDWSRTPSDT